jgi:hypothetical protein
MMHRFGIAQARHDTIVTVSEPARDLSWAMLGLVYKPIGRHVHDLFNVGLFSPMLGKDNPSKNRARPVCEPTLLVLI